MDEFEWNVVHEGQLLDAMAGHKPVGINKYFQMAFIWAKLTENIKKDVQSTKIWTHLETMYNLEALDENEALPFPNDERDFNLPEAEYGALKMKKDERQQQQPDDKKNQKGRETPKIPGGKEETTKPAAAKNNVKEQQGPRRDSKDAKEVKVTTVPVAKKEIGSKKEPEKGKVMKGRPSQIKEEQQRRSRSNDDSSRAPKRPTRGSLKPEETGNGGGAGGKASPLTVGASAPKRRRI